MAERYRKGTIAPSPIGSGRLVEVADVAGRAYRQAMDRFALHEGAAAAYRLIDATNEFIAESEPWALAKDPAAASRLDQVLYDTAEALRLAAVWLQPVMPTSCAEILRRAGDDTPAAGLRLSRDGVWQAGRARTMLKSPALWPRLESPAGAAGPVTETVVTDQNQPPLAAPVPAAGTVAEAQASNPAAGAGAPAPAAADRPPAAATAPAPAGPARITIDQFMAVDLRVATVLAAERVPKSKKLVKLSVDVGTETRTLVAGIAEAYEPDALVGRTVVIVANLQPATLMGIESNGMVLAASPEGGKPELVAFRPRRPRGRASADGERMIDSHCHLADEAFVKDASEVVVRARAAGVRGALCILDAGNDEEVARALRLRGEWPGLRFAVGVHPHHAARFAEPGAAEAAVRGRLDVACPCAVGEIGLDYHYDFAPRDVQQAVLAEQLTLALAIDLPVVIHAREADEDVARMVADVGRGGSRGVFHCFTGDVGFARTVLDLGFHVSLAGIVTFPRADSLRDVARFVPDDRLLIETDSPYLAPVPHRGKRNEPAWVTRVAETLAEVRGTTREAVAALTTGNFERLFGGLREPAAR